MSILERGRRAAEARMTARATVRRRDGFTTVGGVQVPLWVDVVAGSPFRLGGSQGAAPSRAVTVGGVEVQVAARFANFPASTAALADGDVIEVTAGDNAGLFLQVVESTWQDQSTARRVPVVQTVEPEGWA